MSKFFIYRPVFAGVIAIIIVLAGFVSANLLAVSALTSHTLEDRRLRPGEADVARRTHGRNRFRQIHCRGNAAGNGLSGAGCGHAGP